jgi:hypothetical protein
MGRNGLNCLVSLPVDSVKVFPSAYFLFEISFLQGGAEDVLLLYPMSRREISLPSLLAILLRGSSHAECSIAN